jgi:microcystin-dependent protein
VNRSVRKEIGTTPRTQKGEMDMAEILNTGKPYLGEIRMFAGNVEPRGWAFCDGRLLTPADFPGLFAVIGTIYGGDGRNTFALPDLRGRVPLGNGMGIGLTPHSLGQPGGGEKTTLTTANLPAHDHTIRATNQPANQTAPQGNVLAQPDAAIFHDPAGATPVNLGLSTGSAGGASPSPVYTLPPFLTLTFIIALEGLDPRGDEARIIPGQQT